LTRGRDGDSPASAPPHLPPSCSSSVVVAARHAHRCAFLSSPVFPSPFHYLLLRHGSHRSASVAPLHCRLHLRSPSSDPAQPAPDPPRTLAPAAVNGRTHSPLPRWLLDPAGAWPREVSMFRCTRSVILATGVSEVGRRSGLARSLPACSGHCRPVPSVSTAGVAPPRACRH
jgi:hypothetical protein